MISAFSHRLRLIEQALSNNGAAFARLQLLERDATPGADDASCQADCGDDDEEGELNRLRDWIVRLRARVARTERRIERLRATVERHDAQLDDIRSRIIWSSGGCAVVRPHARWDARADDKPSRRQAATDGGTASARWPLALQTPHQQKQSRQKPVHAAVSDRSHSARDVDGYGGMTPQLSQSFTSLLSVKRSQQSSARVSAKPASSYRPM